MKRIVILGAGESGAGAAVLAKKQGFDVFVSDMSAIKDKYKKMLDSHGISWEEGRHTEAEILNADEIIKSPGIPCDAPMVRKCAEKGIRIISEIEFAGRYTGSKMICITGSNGKTTTTSLIYHIFKSAGYDVGLAGNIGNSLALQVAEEPHEYYVIEPQARSNLTTCTTSARTLRFSLTSRPTISTATTTACRTTWTPRCAYCRTRPWTTPSSIGTTTR